MGKGGVKEKPPAVSKDANHILTKQMRVAARPGAVCLPFATTRFVLIRDWRYKYTSTYGKLCNESGEKESLPVRTLAIHGAKADVY